MSTDRDWWGLGAEPTSTVQEYLTITHSYSHTITHTTTYRQTLGLLNEICTCFGWKPSVGYRMTAHRRVPLSRPQRVVSMSAFSFLPCRPHGIISMSALGFLLCRPHGDILTSAFDFLPGRPHRVICMSALDFGPYLDNKNNHRNKAVSSGCRCHEVKVLFIQNCWLDTGIMLDE